MHSAVLVIVNMPVCPYVALMDCAHNANAKFRSLYSNGMTFKFKVIYEWGKQKCDFQH